MYDTLIRGGMLHSGLGDAPVRADLAIKDGIIAAIGELREGDAQRVIDAHGACVTPGFIDIHRHADAAVLREGFGAAELCQGLTSIINGACGLSLAPCAGQFSDDLRHYLCPITGTIPADAPIETMAAYLHRLDETPLPLNVGIQAGAGAARVCVCGYHKERVDRADIEAVQRLLQASLDAGAMGISLGLGYEPESFYSTDELTEVLRPFGGTDTVVSVHMRQEGSGVVDALREMLHIARTLDLRVEISHLKSIGKANWHRCTPEMLALIRRAREEGVRIGCDVYPYTAGSTQLIHILPPEAKAGGLDALCVRLRDTSERAKMRERMQTGADFENISLLAGWENIVVSSAAHEGLRQYEGQSIAAIAEAQGKDPFDCVFDLLAEDHGETSMIDYITAEDDIASILREDFSCVISDAIYPSSGLLHPRVYGAFARLIEEYVVRRRVLTLEKAVEKVTSRAAGRYGLTNKGVLRVGADADINIFRPENIREVGSYADPCRTATGFDHVLVGGVSAIQNGVLTGQCAGRTLKR